MESKPHVISKGKIPSTVSSEEYRTHDTASHRTGGPAYYHLSYSSPHDHDLCPFTGGGAGGSTKGEKHCVIMDEVDGMAGNEDRGGLQELVQLIKSTAIPVICICNDRNSIKMRTLANYCFDLRFQRPRLEQIKVSVVCNVAP